MHVQVRPTANRNIDYSIIQYNNSILFIFDRPHQTVLRICFEQIGRVEGKSRQIVLLCKSYSRKRSTILRKKAEFAGEFWLALASRSTEYLSQKRFNLS